MIQLAKMLNVRFKADGGDGTVNSDGNVMFDLIGNDENGYGMRVIWTESGERKVVETGNIGLCHAAAEQVVEELIKGNVQPDTVREIVAEFLYARVFPELLI